MPAVAAVAAVAAAPADPLAALEPLLAALARRGVVRRYRKGTVLIEEGDRGDTLYVVLAGQLRAYSANAAGKEITYGLYGPGEYLGEMSLDGGPRSASVITTADSVCAVVGRVELERFIAEQPGFAFELLAKVIRRARAATLTARQLALNDVYGRLRDCLLQLAGPPDADGRCALREPVTHLDLARRLGCSREMVSRLMKDLELGGYIGAARRRLALLKRLPDRW
jgi:CRP/FNR family cyclic AMP-dependent transcriptional regulator